MGFRNLAEWLLRCSHRRTTLPATHKDKTCVVCLECGRRFEHDWAKMRRGQPVVIPSVAAGSAARPARSV